MSTKQQIIVNTLNTVMRSCVKDDQATITSIKGLSKEALKDEEYLNVALKHDYNSFSNHIKNCFDELRESKVFKNDDNKEELGIITKKFMAKYFGSDLDVLDHKIDTLKLFQFMENNKDSLANFQLDFDSIPAIKEFNPYIEDIKEHFMSIVTLAGQQDQQEGDLSLEDLGL
jgi:hypothetical protein